jgi:hypothetical protein
MIKSKIALAAAFAFALPMAHASAQTSTFDTDTQGWSVVGDQVGPVTWTASGGIRGVCLRHGLRSRRDHVFRRT